MDILKDSLDALCLHVGITGTGWVKRDMVSPLLQMHRKR